MIISVDLRHPRNRFALSVSTSPAGPGGIHSEQLPGPIYTLVSNKYYVDEIYAARHRQADRRHFPGTCFGTGIDEGVIDTGVVNGLASLIRGWGIAVPPIAIRQHS